MVIFDIEKYLQLRSGFHETLRRIAQGVIRKSPHPSRRLLPGGSTLVLENRIRGQIADGEALILYHSQIQHCSIIHANRAGMGVRGFAGV